MYDANYYIDLAVDLFAGFPHHDLPVGYNESMINDEMIRDFAITLTERYPSDVQQNMWTSMDLRKNLDYFLDECEPIVKHLVFGDRSFSESERTVIVEHSAKVICKRLQRHCRLTVHYKTFPNGRAGYRLE